MLRAKGQVGQSLQIVMFQSKRKARNFADRAREFALSSSGEASTGFFRMQRPNGVLWQTQTGKPGGHVQGFCHFLKAIFTRLSSPL